MRLKAFEDLTFLNILEVWFEDAIFWPKFVAFINEICGLKVEEFLSFYSKFWVLLVVKFKQLGILRVFLNIFLGLDIVS